MFKKKVAAVCKKYRQETGLNSPATSPSKGLATTSNVRGVERPNLREYVVGVLLNSAHLNEVDAPEQLKKSMERWEDCEPEAVNFIRECCKHMFDIASYKRLIPKLDHGRGRGPCWNPLMVRAPTAWDIHNIGRVQEGRRPMTIVEMAMSDFQDANDDRVETGLPAFTFDDYLSEVKQRADEEYIARKAAEKEANERARLQHLAARDASLPADTAATTSETTTAQDAPEGNKSKTRALSTRKTRASTRKTRASTRKTRASTRKTKASANVDDSEIPARRFGAISPVRRGKSAAKKKAATQAAESKSDMTEVAATPANGRTALPTRRRVGTLKRKSDSDSDSDNDDDNNNDNNSNNDNDNDNDSPPMKRLKTDLPRTESNDEPPSPMKTRSGMRIMGSNKVTTPPSA